MSTGERFQPGDTVHHPKRPEWGEGKVCSAADSPQGGKPGQRLVVDFANHRRVTIQTAIVPLVPANATTAAAGAEDEDGWLGELAGRGESTSVNEGLGGLPEAMTDPFTGLRRRLETLLESYRFSNTQRGIFDWAVAQTGLNDPLTEYSRAEIEAAFERFCDMRWKQLQRLVTDAQHNREDAVLEAVLESCRVPEGRTAMETAMGKGGGSRKGGGPSRGSTRKSGR